MRFSTAFSVLACGAVALAAVTPNVASRSTADVVAVVGTLAGRLSPIFNELGGCADANCTTKCAGEISAAFKTATGSTVGLNGTATPDYDDDVAKIVTDVTQQLKTHKDACAGTCGDLSVYAQVDASCAGWLEQGETSVPGTLAGVKPRVANVAGVWVGLGLTKVAGLFA